MKDLFNQALVTEYNQEFNGIIIFDCDCYRKYREDFEDYIFKKRNSYTACIVQTKFGVDGSESAVVFHQCLPIMLGTYIDSVISKKGVYRGTNLNNVVKMDEKFQNNDDFIGGFLINGGLKYIQLFLANNLRGGHLYVTKNKKKQDVRHFRYNIVDEVNCLYVDIDYESQNKVGFSIKPIAVKTKKTQKPQVANLSESLFNGKWSTALNLNSNLLNKDDEPSDEDWIAFFEDAMEHYPSLDQLANKVFLTPTRILARCLQKNTLRCKTLDKHYFHKTDAKKTVDVKKPSEFDSGNLFHTIRNKLSTVINAKFETMYISLDGTKCSQMSQLSSTVKRHVKKESRSLKALGFPEDGQHYICPLTVKDLKDAGETLALAQLLYVSFRAHLNREMVHKFFQSIHDPNGTITITVHSYLTRYKIAKFDEELFIKIKKLNTNITVMLLGKHLDFTFAGGMLIKYTNKYAKSHDFGMYISCYEYRHFDFLKDAFDSHSPMAQFSNFAMRIGDEFPHLLEAKATVAIQNMKGSCHVIKNTGLSSCLFFYSVGYNSALNYKITKKRPLQLPEEEKFPSTNKHHKTIDGLVKCTNPCRYCNETSNDEECIKIVLSRPTKNVGIIKNFVEEDHHVMIPIALNSCNSFTNQQYLQLAETDEPCPPRVKEHFDAAQLPDVKHNTEINGRTYSELVKNYKKEHLIHPFIKYFPIIVDKGSRFSVLIDSKFLQNINALETVIQEGGTVGILASRLAREQQNQDSRIVLYIESVKKIPGAEIQNEYAINYADYLEYITFDPDYKYSNQLILYTAIGDIGGGTVEDGIILDKTFVENGPVKLITVTLIIDYEVVEDSKLNNEIKYAGINATIDTHLVFGVLLSKKRLILKKMRNVHVTPSNVGDAWRYLIYTDNYTNIKKIVSSEIEVKGKWVTLRYIYETRLGVGTKLANLHGQKGVVCKVVDLSGIKAWTRDGKCIHPQVLFSPQSVLGRTTASQVRQMHLGDFGWTNDDLPVCVSPLAFNVHYIDPGTKTKLAYPKSDLMTNENGFIANGLSVLNNVLNQYTRKTDAIKAICELYRCDGIDISFLEVNNGLLVGSDAEDDGMKKCTTEEQQQQQQPLPPSKVAKRSADDYQATTSTSTSKPPTKKPKIKAIQPTCLDLYDT